MTFVQAALELVAQKRGDRLAGAHAVHQGERVANPSRREVDGKRIRQRRIGVR